MKRLGNEGDVVQLNWQLVLRRARNKHERHMLAFENTRNLERLVVCHIDIQKAKSRAGTGSADGGVQRPPRHGIPLSPMAATDQGSH